MFEILLSRSYARDATQVIRFSDVAQRAFYVLVPAVLVAAFAPWAVESAGRVAGSLAIALGFAIAAGLVRVVVEPLDDLGRTIIVAFVSIAAAVSAGTAIALHDREAAANVTSVGAGLGAAERALLGHVDDPPTACSSVTPSRFASAAVVCVPDGAAHRVHYEQFQSWTSLEQRIVQRAKARLRTRAFRRKCASAYGRRLAAFEMSNGDIYVCFGGRSSSWIEYGQKSTRILVRTYRRDTKPGRLLEGAFWPRFASVEALR